VRSTWQNLCRVRHSAKPLPRAKGPLPSAGISSSGEYMIWTLWVIQGHLQKFLKPTLNLDFFNKIEKNCSSTTPYHNSQTSHT
jgi:hypothetical protein